MSRRGRLLGFGLAALLVLAGVLTAVLVKGVAGDALTIVLLSLGLGGAVLLGFYEIGLSEDRARALEDETRRRRQEARLRPDRPRPWQQRWSRRPRG